MAFDSRLLSLCGGGMKNRPNGLVHLFINAIFYYLQVFLFMYWQNRQNEDKDQFVVSEREPYTFIVLLPFRAAWTALHSISNKDHAL